MQKIEYFIPQMAPLFGVEERNALISYMDEGGYLTEFKRTEFFESQIAAYTGSKHCIVVNNGTISLTLAALALGLSYGDEVIVPNYTMIGTPNSVKLIGCTPIFVDVNAVDLCINIDLLKQAITTKTKAVILVSPNGRFPSYDVGLLRSYLDGLGVALIEDSAQSLGSKFPDGSHIGTKGAIGSFSFSAPKIISTGQGGALITNDDHLAHRLRRLKDFGRAEGGIDIHDTIGFNFKFTELQACVGIEQMIKLEARIARKKELWIRYKKNLEGTKQIKLFEHNLEYTTPSFIDSIVDDREKLIEHLKKFNVGSRKMYPPINKQNAYLVSGSHSVSENIGECGLWLPSSVGLSDGEVDYICDAIKYFYLNQH